MSTLKKRSSVSGHANGLQGPKKAKTSTESRCCPFFQLKSEHQNLNVDKQTVELLERKYQCKFPPDFFKFFDFCKSLGCSDFKQTLADAGLSLCGPFDLLLNSDNASLVDKTDWLTHCRFMHDPPEFTTLLCTTYPKSELHIGYVRDDPADLPVFLAITDSRRGGKFFPLGPNIFAALLAFIEDKNLEAAEELVSKLEAFCKKHKICMERKTAEMRSRNKLIVAKTLNHLGLVVPMEDDVGYRELPETDAKLLKMLDRIAQAYDEEADEDRQVALLEPVYEIVTLIQFANDEGDPGMGLELGLDLLSIPSRRGCYDSLIQTLLETGYRLVKRDLYREIITSHMSCRFRYREVSAKK